MSLAFCALALALFHANILVTGGTVLSAALFAGTLLSRQVRSGGALVTMLAVAAIVDLISTLAGPSRWLAGQALHPHGVPLLQYFAVSIWWKGTLVPVIGEGDLVFFTASATVMRRLGWPETPALLVPLTGLLAALGVGLFAGFTPALPFLAAAVILYAWVSPLAKHQPCRG